MTRKIGAGSFGTAQLALVRATGAQVVIKLVDVRELGEEERRAAKREASILSALHHPCILAHLETFEDNGFLCIATEFCERGDIGARLEERKGRPLSEAQILDWFTQICLGMLYCHKKRVLHRDLKLANVFLAADNSVKLGDFGIARVLKNTMEMVRAHARGARSLRMLKRSRTSERVVRITKTAKTSVMMGSAMRHEGLHQMSAPAIATPTDWTVSPSTWMKAPRTLMEEPWWWWSWWSWSWSWWWS